MIHDEIAMPSPVSETAMPAHSNAGEIANAVVIAPKRSTSIPRNT